MWSLINPAFHELLLMLVCCLGDYHLQHPVAREKYVVAIGDSITHGLVAGLSWALVCDSRYKREELIQCLICVVLAMAVDIDHFLSAGSLSLKAALSLPNRPPFHATTVIFIVDIIMVTMATIMRSQNLVLGAMIFTVAWFTHHVRDGYRRGLWFYPFGETSPLPQTVYLGTIVLFPLFMKMVYFYTYKHILKSRTPVLSTEGEIV